MRNQQRSEETRASLLQAAEQCLAEQGYASTSVAEICRCAGVSKGAFYHHFESKQAMFMALLEDWLADLEQALAPIAAVAPSTPEALVEMARAAQSTFQSNDKRTSIILEFWTQASRNAMVRHASLATYRHYQEFFAELIQRGIEEDVFAAVDPIAGAQVMLSLASGLFFQGMLDPQGADWGEIAEKSIDILLNGLKRRSE